MKSFELGILGNIETISCAKRIVNIAGVSIILSSLIGMTGGNYAHLLVILLSIWMIFTSSRIPSVVLVLWMLFYSFISIIMALGGRIFEYQGYSSFYLPILSLCVTWLTYRSVRATFFIHSSGDDFDIDTIQNVFE